MQRWGVLPPCSAAGGMPNLGLHTPAHHCSNGWMLRACRSLPRRFGVAVRRLVGAQASEAGGLWKVAGAGAQADLVSVRGWQPSREEVEADISRLGGRRARSNITALKRELANHGGAEDGARERLGTLLRVRRWSGLTTTDILDRWQYLWSGAACMPIGWTWRSVNHLQTSRCFSVASCSRGSTRASAR